MGRGNALRSSQIHIITAKVKKLWRQIHNWTALIWWSFCRWWQHNFRPLDLQAFHRLFSVGLPTGLIIMPYWLQTCTIWIQLKCCLNTALLSQQERAVAPLLSLRFFCFGKLFWQNMSTFWHLSLKHRNIPFPADHGRQPLWPGDCTLGVPKFPKLET